METVSVKTRPSTTPPPYAMTKVSFMGLAVRLLVWSYVPRVLEFHLVRAGSRTHLGRVVRGSFGKEDHFQTKISQERRACVKFQGDALSSNGHLGIPLKPRRPNSRYANCSTLKR